MQLIFSSLMVIVSISICDTKAFKIINLKSFAASTNTIVRIPESSRSDKDIKKLNYILSNSNFEMNDLSPKT